MKTKGYSTKKMIKSAMRIYAILLKNKTSASRNAPKDSFSQFKMNAAKTHIFMFDSSLIKRTFSEINA